MHRFRYKHLLVFALVLGCGGIARQANHRVAQPNNPPATAQLLQATQGKQSPQDSAAITASPATTVASLPVAIVLQEDPAPADIQAIFPSVKSAVKNWRKFRPDSYTVHAIPEQPEITFHVENVWDEGLFTTWVGRSALPGESLVVVATQEGIDAIVTSYEGQPVELHVRGSKATVFQTEGLPAGECGLAGGPNSLASSIVNPSTGSADATLTANLETFWTANGLDGAGNLISRVACFYDAATLAFASSCAPDGNGTSLLNSTYKARLEAGNTALANSEINVRWVYLGCALAPTATATAAMDVWNEVKATSPTGDFIRKKATEWGATQVFFGYLNVTGNFGGYGDLPGHYSVGSWNRNYLLLVHELSHNFGLKHDRYTDSALTNPNNSDYSFAVNMVSRIPTGASLVIGTIMSYARYTVPYFSNASLTVDPALVAQLDSAAYASNYQTFSPVLVTGATSNFYYGPPAASVDASLIVQLGSSQPLGIPAGQPNAADASRLFRENAASTISGGWYTAPEITTQPQSAAVTTGQGFTVSVTTRGTGAITYQWRKDASPIAGAINASYSVVSATASDAAAYSVAVTATDVLNSVTILTSNDAKITVNAPGSNSGSSGGGGGFIDTFFGCALITVAFGRLLLVRKP